MSAADTLELPLPKMSNAEKQRRAADAIAENPEKSDRAIAAEIGVDHKTVAKARKSTGEKSPVGEISPSQRTGESSGEISPRKNSPLNGEISPSQNSPDRNADDGAAILCPNQSEVTAGFDADGDLIMRQSNWPDEDATIVIRADNIMNFLDQLTDICGIPRLP